MPHDLPKAYDPTAIEDHWAEYWVRENLFAVEAPGPNGAIPASSASADAASASPASGCPDGQSAFTILLPPPNVTGRLHMGHMLNQTEMDILTRWRRMSGRKALWLPGTDHAGIATQMMVERQLEGEGKKRQDLGREAFVERVWEWKRHYGGAILDQMKRLGASVDWHREYFTMDDNLSVAVREAFVRLHDQGLIYRGAYIVNWCPRCQTAISDLEVVHDEQKGHLWEIRYPVIGPAGGELSGEFLTVATTRPETMLGDVAVAIHPADERYKHLHGKKLRLPLMGREIPIILDEWVSLDFGTGAVKVTPAHDPNDFALGERHHLPSINIMDDTGKINAAGGSFAGLDRYAARKKVVAELEELGLLAGIKDHTNNVGHCDRCKTVVEPRLSTQWFIKIEPLAEKARQAVREKHIKFTPEMYEKTYFEWMDNIHDWCISRQLWWGHRIPAWHCADCHKITVARVDPTACQHCGSAKITQETDVLDTWFSSGLLPVSVFGWPNVTAENRNDFDAFYPTSVLVTGFDILFFWVARMIMMGCWFAADVPMPDGSPRTLADSVPFREVYIHALVRDANREKMSKTKGNVVDPIEIVRQYGTDAVRFTLASMASPGTDIAFNVARTEGYRAFANKIWNAARFLFMNVDRAAELGITVDPTALGSIPVVGSGDSDFARWIWAEFHQTARQVDVSLTNYRYDDAANTIYQFFWGSFCDKSVEFAKVRLDFSEGADRTKTKAVLTTLLQVFEATLRLLSPFMPFLTEELWHAVYDGNPPAKSIALASYPVVHTEQYDLVVGGAFADGVQVRMKYSWDLIGDVLSKRKESGVPEKESVPVVIHAVPVALGAFTANVDVISKMAHVSTFEFSDSDLEGPEVFRNFGFYSGKIVYERTVDVAAETDRLNKDIARYEKGIAAAERQLGNPGFLAKAPANVVEGLKRQEAETRLLLDKAREALAALPTE
jgi:valyl-tRNA synthetase